MTKGEIGAARLRALPNVYCRYGRRGRRAALGQRADPRGRRSCGAGIAKRADKKLVTDFKAVLQARVGKALSAKFRDLIKQVGTSGAKIGDQVEAILKDSPSWAEGTVADRLFAEWVGPAPVGGHSPTGAQDLWAALRRAGGSSVASKRPVACPRPRSRAWTATELNAVGHCWTRASRGW